MAIVKMKRLRVMAMAEQQETLLQALQRMGCVEIGEPEQLLANSAWAALVHRGTSRFVQTRGRQTDVETALNTLKKYGKLKDGLFIQRHPITAAEFESVDAAQTAGETVEKVNGFLQMLTALDGEAEHLRAKHASLLPWSGLDLPLAQQGTAHTRFLLGVLPGAADFGVVKTALAASDAAAEIFEISADRQLHYVLLICHRADEEAALAVLRTKDFSAVSFPDVAGTAAQELSALEHALAENETRRKETASAIADCAGAREALRVYADRLSAQAALEGCEEQLLTDGTIAFFEGWVPAEKLAAVTELLERENCAWEAADPTPEEIPDVPVSLKNNWLTKPLNMVTEMYSLPAYDNVDPNPLMAPFFILFYGVMMADMGYGLLMILASLVISKKYRPKGTAGHLFGLLGLCGVSTFIMGAVTGGFFGDFIPQLAKLINPNTSLTALPALFTPLNDTLMILIGAMCLGFVQIVTGMAISLVHKLRRGEFLDALWEEVTWWIVFAGLGLMVAGVTQWVLWLGVAMVLVGSGWNAKGFGKVTAVFASLYNHVTGYFGDILSYSRLMALMLAGSVIAQVFNTLGAIPGNIPVFILISLVGNALNFALNLLGCYVHDLRLQCLEYFNKFYADGGKAFRPLAVHTKYVDIETI